MPVLFKNNAVYLIIGKPVYTFQNCKQQNQLYQSKTNESKIKNPNQKPINIMNPW